MTHDPFAPGISLPNLIGVIPDWVEHAPCGLVVNPEQDPDDFYPISSVGVRKDSSRPDPNEAAKKVCTRCDVREKCLAWAIESHETHGVWGGLSPEERQAITGPPPRIETARGICRRCKKPADKPRSEFCGDECRADNKREYDRVRTAKVRAEAREAS